MAQLNTPTAYLEQVSVWDEGNTEHIWPQGGSNVL